MTKSYFTVFLLLSLMLVNMASAQTLIITNDIGLNSGQVACFGVNFEPFVPVHGQILATPEAGGGVAGAEFMIELPADVAVTSLVAASYVSSAGSPFVGPLGGGVLVLVNPCQAFTSGDLLLYEFTLMSLGFSGEFELQIVKRTNPSNPSFDGPVILNCDPQLVAAQQSYRAYVGPATDPFPADQATNMPVDVVLTWSTRMFNCGCASVPARHVYFGTDPDPPLTNFWPDSPQVYDPGPLAANTTYYWRASASFCGASGSGPVWSFTTSDIISVEVQNWSHVKRLFR